MGNIPFVGRLAVCAVAVLILSLLVFWRPEGFLTRSAGHDHPVAEHVDPVALLEELRLQADQGDIPSVIKLADLYYEGAEGVPRDPERAAGLYRLVSFGSAGLRGTDACLRWMRLGNMYRDGDGVQQDAEKAAEYYGNAARYVTQPGKYLLSRRDHGFQTDAEIAKWCEEEIAQRRKRDARRNALWKAYREQVDLRQERRCKVVYPKPHISMSGAYVLFIGFFYLGRGLLLYVRGRRQTETAIRRRGRMLAAIGMLVLALPFFPALVRPDTELAGYCVEPFFDLIVRFIPFLYLFLPVFYLFAFLWHKKQQTRMRESVAEHLRISVYAVVTFTLIIVALKTLSVVGDMILDAVN